MFFVIFIKNANTKTKRTDKEVVIKIPASVNTDDLEQMVDFIRFKEITSKSKATGKKLMH